MAMRSQSGIGVLHGVSVRLGSENTGNQPGNPGVQSAADGIASFPFFFGYRIVSASRSASEDRRRLEKAQGSVLLIIQEWSSTGRSSRGMSKKILGYSRPDSEFAGPSRHQKGDRFQGSKWQVMVSPPGTLNLDYL